MHTLPNSEEERHHSPKITLGRVGSEFWKKTRVSNSDFTQDQQRSDVATLACVQRHPHPRGLRDTTETNLSPRDLLFFGMVV